MERRRRKERIRRGRGEWRYEKGRDEQKEEVEEKEEEDEEDEEEDGWRHVVLGGTQKLSVNRRHNEIIKGGASIAKSMKKTCCPVALFDKIRRARGKSLKLCHTAMTQAFENFSTTRKVAYMT